MPLAYGLLEPADLVLPALPGGCSGLRLAHLTDLHIRRERGVYQRLGNQLAGHRLDLILLTGDYMTEDGDEDVALEVLGSVLERARPTHGSFGVFGNHDSPAFRERAEGLGVTWLADSVSRLEGVAIDVVGVDTDHRGGTDLVRTALAVSELGGKVGGADGRLRLFLSHYPNRVFHAADLGADVVLSGHTHGGQIRLPGRRALYNSCDLPLDRSAGIMRHGDTLLGVSRGVGEMMVNVRTWCRAHVPVYTLRQGPMPGRATMGLENVQPW